MKHAKGKSLIFVYLGHGLAALFNTLDWNCLLKSTPIFVTGQFGRTPKVNQRAGRDHRGRAIFVLMAGRPVMIVRDGKVIAELFA